MITKDFESAVMCLENIKAEIKNKLIRKNFKKDLKRIQNIILWYGQLPLSYTQKTEQGYQLIFPIDIELKIKRNLNVAYELIIKNLGLLDLI